MTVVWDMRGSAPFSKIWLIICSDFLRCYFFKKIESIIFPSRNILKAFSKENFLEFYIKIPTKVRLK